ncbi:hypothetical protein, partial [Chitinimonas sp.]|uniref:hypothetical protein n=1 Tax=Chitinimonas sp. TaxID=1934313 RepID=UPI002F925703
AKPVSRNGNSAPESFAPVTVDYSLVREQDGGRRMVFSSSNGEVLDAVDIPLEPAPVPTEPPRWTASVLYKPGGGYGAGVSRNLGQASVGGLALKPPGRAAEAWIMAGWSF